MSNGFNTHLEDYEMKSFVCMFEIFYKATRNEHFMETEDNI